jgi:hypothetical protein
VLSLFPKSPEIYPGCCTVAAQIQGLARQERFTFPGSAHEAAGLRSGECAGPRGKEHVARSHGRPPEFVTSSTATLRRYEINLSVYGHQLDPQEIHRRPAQVEPPLEEPVAPAKISPAFGRTGPGTERRGVDHPLAYHQPQTCRNASVGGISKCTQQRTMDAEFAIEGLRGHADGGGLQRDDRVSDLTRNIRPRILKELRHDRRIEDVLLRTIGSLCCVSHARDLGLFHFHSFCLAGFSICLLRVPNHCCRLYAYQHWYPRGAGQDDEDETFRSAFVLMHGILVRETP